MMRIDSHPFRLFIIFCLLIGSASDIPCQEKTDPLAPPFSLSSFDGTKHSLEELLGNKLTVIVFWSTWGKDSIKMLADMERLFEKYQKRGLNVVGICVEQQNIDDVTRQHIADTVKQIRLNFPILLDDQLKTFRAYGVIAVPTTFVIDKNRKIVYHLSGYPIVGRDEIENCVMEQFEGVKLARKFIKKEREPDKEALRFYGMAHLSFSKGEIETVKKYALKSIGIDSLYSDPVLLLAEVSIMDDSLDDAMKYISLAYELKADSLTLLNLKGFLLARSGQWQNAVSLFEKLANEDSSNVLVHCYLGYTLGLGGNLQRALDEFSKAERLSKTEFRIPLLKIEIYKKFKKYKEAASELNKLREDGRK